MCEQFFSAVEEYFIPITKPFGMGYCSARIDNTHQFIFDISLDDGSLAFICGTKEAYRPVDIAYLLPDKDGLFGIGWLYQFSQKESQAHDAQFC